MKPLHDDGRCGKAEIHKRIYGSADGRKLASLRGLPLPGIEAALADGIVSFGVYQKARAWFVRDENGASVRRLDGNPWRTTKGNAKALDTAGTLGRRVNGWPIGILGAKNAQTIIVCEGGPDLLAAYAARADLRGDFGIVCLLGAALTIHESALPHFSGKRVRFIADTDAPGLRFAERNANLLATIAEEVTIANLGDLLNVSGRPATDLCDVLAFREPWHVPDDIAALFDFTRRSPRVRIITAQSALLAGSQGQDKLVTQEDSRITQGGHKRTQKMGGRKYQGHFQDLHEIARDLASTERGQTQRRLFDLARAVLGFETHRGHEDRAMRDAVFETWFSASQGNLDPKEKRPHYLARFRSRFRKVRVIPGQRDALKEAEERARVSTLPDIPDAPDAPDGWRMLASVCRELQRLAGEAPFFIGMRDAARIATGQPHPQTGGRILEALAEFGVIRCVKKGQATPGGDASEYLYLLP